MYHRIFIVGGGNLGRSFLELAMRKGMPKEFLGISVKDLNKERSYSDYYGIQPKPTTELLYGLNHLDTVCLCVKPKDVEETLPVVSSMIPKETPLVSAVAGLSWNKLNQQLLGKPVVRIMPSILNAKNLGTVVCYHPNPDEKIRQHVNHLVGKNQQYWTLSEEELELSTILNGCAPALIAEFSKSLEQFALKHHFPLELARYLIYSNLKGTAEILDKTTVDEFQKQIATPGGITEEGLVNLRQNPIFDTTLEKMYQKLIPE